VYAGREFCIDEDRYISNITFNSGGPGYVIDNWALDKLGQALSSKDPECKTDKKTSAEDTHLAACLRHLGIYPMETRDALARNRFHHKSPHETWTSLDFDWFAQNSLPPVLYGPESISDTSISFHWVHAEDMLAIDYYFMQCRYYKNRDIIDNLYRG
jgi:hypothetical protein